MTTPMPQSCAAMPCACQLPRDGLASRILGQTNRCLHAVTSLPASCRSRMSQQTQVMPAAEDVHDHLHAMLSLATIASQEQQCQVSPT